MLLCAESGDGATLPLGFGPGHPNLLHLSGQKETLEHEAVRGLLSPTLGEEMARSRLCGALIPEG